MSKDLYITLAIVGCIVIGCLCVAIKNLCIYETNGNDAQIYQVVVDRMNRNYQSLEEGTTQSKFLTYP